jgi:hypothetical protein
MTGTGPLRRRNDVPRHVPEGLMSDLASPLHPPYALPSLAPQPSGRDAPAGNDPVAAPRAAAEPAPEPREVASRLSLPYVPPAMRPATESGGDGTASRPDALAPFAAAQQTGGDLAQRAAAEADVVPSIAQFLEEDAASGTRPLESSLAPESPVAFRPSAASDVAPALPVDPGFLAAPWPLADASAEVARLANGLPIRAALGRERDAARGPGDPTLPRETGGGSLDELSPWSDDDAWFDIMPAVSPIVSRDLEERTAWARAFAEPPAPLPASPAPAGDAVAAARALDAVARRVRAGELVLPAWPAHGGDAAALAATLTALLGEPR